MKGALVHLVYWERARVYVHAKVCAAFDDTSKQWDLFWGRVVGGVVRLILVWVSGVGALALNRIRVAIHVPDLRSLRARHK